MVYISNSSIPVNDHHQWMAYQQQQITQHIAWHGNLSEAASERMLSDQAPYTFVLRNGDKENAYFISFVKKDGNIKHQNFALEHDRKGWIYKNGVTDGLMEAVAKDIEDLIPLMMHCEFLGSIPLSSNCK